MRWRSGESRRRWIVARFAVTSLLVFVLVGFAISFISTRDLRQHEENTAKARSQLVAGAVIAPVLMAHPPKGPLTGAHLEAMNKIVKQMIENDGAIKRVKIWDTSGTVVYSNDPQEIGQQSVEDDLHEAIEGQTESDISDLTKAENAGERPLANKLFETYVPVRTAVDGPVIAVVEVYRDYSVIQAEIDQFARTLAISLGVGLLVLYVLLLPLMVGTTRTLRRQNEQLTEQADLLSDLLEREQATVAELRELDRMKSDFVAASSHELRTPLTSILGYAGILRSTAGDDPIAHESIDAIERQGNRMLRLVMNLLTESRIEGDRSSSVSVFDVTALMREVAGDFHLDGDRIHVEVVPGTEAQCDRTKVADILVNLLDNALKYSRPGTPVTLAASVAGDTLSLRVRDEGPGIEPGDIPRIFDRFYQTDQSSTRAHGGVGLGLHIVKGLVESMDGRVTVESERGSGSVFSAIIPMVRADEPVAAQYLNA